MMLKARNKYGELLKQCKDHKYLLKKQLVDKKDQDPASKQPQEKPQDPLEKK